MYHCRCLRKPSEATSKRSHNDSCTTQQRGRGLWVGIEIKTSSGSARPYCEALQDLGILAKETHDQVVRIAPPLVVTREEIDWAVERIREVVSVNRAAVTA